MGDDKETERSGCERGGGGNGEKGRTGESQGAHEGAEEGDSKAGRRSQVGSEEGEVIYVLVTEGYVKIGTSSNLQARLAKHRTYSNKHYGTWRFLGWLPGERNLDIQLRGALDKFRAPGVSLAGSLSYDWFCRCPEVDAFIAGLRLREPSEIKGGSAEGIKRKPTSKKAKK